MVTGSWRCSCFSSLPGEAILDIWLLLIRRASAFLPLFEHFYVVPGHRKHILKYKTGSFVRLKWVMYKWHLLNFSEFISLLPLVSIFTCDRAIKSMGSTLFLLSIITHIIHDQVLSPKITGSGTVSNATRVPNWSVAVPDQSTWSSDDSVKGTWFETAKIKSLIRHSK